MHAPLVKPDPRAAILLGVPFHDVTMEETLDHIDWLVTRGQPSYLATANLDFAAQASQDVELQRILLEAELVLCDGTPLVWASRWLGAPLRERVAGSDMLPHLFARAADRGHRLFFLGASEDVLATATAKCRAEYPGLDICGAYAPPFAKLLEIDHEEIARRIKAAQPDVLLVAMGCPKQEKWIYMHYRELGVPVSMGIGASLDFVAGKFRRAPVWARVCGLEWVFRLLQEPRRLFNRYCFDLLFFVQALRKQRRLLQARTAHAAPAQEQREPEKIAHAVQYRWSGRIDAAAVTASRIAAILPEPNSPNAVLDCSAVEFIDSTGLGLLVKSFRACKQAGGVFVILAPGEPVTRMLSVLKLDRLIPIAQGEAELPGLLPREKASDYFGFDASQRKVTFQVASDITAASVSGLQRLLLNAWNLAPTATSLHLDLEKVSFIDSSGLGFLVKALKLAKQRAGGALAILNPSPNVCNVIRLANLHTILGTPA